MLHGPPLGQGTSVLSRAEWRTTVRDGQAEFPNARAFTRELETMVFR
jgi:hypothetical protein